MPGDPPARSSSFRGCVCPWQSRCSGGGRDVLRAIFPGQAAHGVVIQGGRVAGKLPAGRLNVQGGVCPRPPRRSGGTCCRRQRSSLQQSTRRGRRVGWWVFPPAASSFRGGGKPAAASLFERDVLSSPRAILPRPPRRSVGMCCRRSSRDVLPAILLRPPRRLGGGRCWRFSCPSSACTRPPGWPCRRRSSGGRIVCSGGTCCCRSSRLAVVISLRA